MYNILSFLLNNNNYYLLIKRLGNYETAILPLSYTVNCFDTWIAFSFPICLQ